MQLAHANSNPVHFISPVLGLLDRYRLALDVVSLIPQTVALVLRFCGLLTEGGTFRLLLAITLRHSLVVLSRQFGVRIRSGGEVLSVCFCCGDGDADQER
uniref:Uncharacterized protein n=1 Tax=Ralstonia solanacearum TaxID=305 RepID=A0A0S4WMC0_RALSL|nr:protein of unknown function [Ralstonia solanacearum]